MTADVLPTYSLILSCLKCRHGDINTEYHPFRPTLIGGETFTVSRCVSPGETLDECVLRRCLNCGWAWLEACADAEPEMVTRQPGTQGVGRDAPT